LFYPRKLEKKGVFMNLEDSSLSRKTRWWLFLGEKVKCSVCGAGFDSQDNLYDHVVEVHDSECVLCGARMNSKIEWIVHNKEKHGM
jgi:hypothetical protein